MGISHLRSSFSLVGYSPQGRKESDTTERLHFHFDVIAIITISIFTIYLFIFGCVGSSLMLWRFSSCSMWGLSCCGAQALGCMSFSGRGSGALERRLSSCGVWAWLSQVTWDPPGPGIETMSPALPGGFFTTEPLTKPPSLLLLNCFSGRVTCSKCQSWLSGNSRIGTQLVLFQNPHTQVFLLPSSAGLNVPLWSLPVTQNNNSSHFCFFFSFRDTAEVWRVF